MGNADAAVWWVLMADMHLDAQFTLADLWARLVQCFFVPGNFVLWCLVTYAPPLARLVELSPADYHGVFTGIISAMFWLAAIVLCGAAYNFIRRIDRVVTGGFVKFYREWLRRKRVGRIWVYCQLRAIKPRLLTGKKSTEPAIDFDEFELGELELEALRSHAFLAPGYVLGASDIASALEIRTAQARQVLERLEKLGLIETTIGTSDGESGSRISRTGQFVLMARSRIAES